METVRGRFLRCGYPDPERGDVTELLSREAAIRLQRSSAMVSAGYVYESDERALEDFMVVHWADWVEADITLK